MIRLEGAIAAAVPDWSLAKVVTALMAVRGLDLISATIFLAEIGDLSRFASPRELMAYLGLVPGEQSTGETVWRGGITKAGNHRARRILVECSWSYRHPPRVGKKKLAKVEAAPPAVQEIAWKAQARLTARYRALARPRRRRCETPTNLTRGQAPGRDPADKYRARAGAKSRQGNSRFRCVADQTIDARA